MAIWSPARLFCVLQRPWNPNFKKFLRTISFFRFCLTEIEWHLTATRRLRSWAQNTPEMRLRRSQNLVGYSASDRLAGKLGIDGALPAKERKGKERKEKWKGRNGRKRPKYFLPCPHFPNQNFKWRKVCHLTQSARAHIEIKASKHKNRHILCASAKDIEILVARLLHQVILPNGWSRLNTNGVYLVSSTKFKCSFSNNKAGFSRHSIVFMER